MKIKRRKSKQKPEQKQGWDLSKPLPWIKVESEHEQDKAQFASEKDDSPIQQIRSEELQRKIDFLDVEKPIVEMHTLEGEKTVLPTDELMFGANQFAGLIETKGSLQVVTDCYLERITFERNDNGIDNLDRIEIRENGPKLWSIRVRYNVDQEGESGMMVLLDDTNRPFNLDNARQVAEDFIAYSMYIDGKTNTENGIRQRVFQFDEATVTVSRSLFMHVKEFVNQSPELHDTSKYEALYYQKFVDRFGGKFTDMDISRLHKDDFSVLQITTAFSLVRGIYRWPFEER